MTDRTHSGRTSLTATALMLAALIVVASLAGGISRAASPVKSVDEAARVAKARHLVEAAGPLMADNMLGAAELFTRASRLAPNDTVVRMAVNDIRLMLSPRANDLYYPQLEMLEATPNAPIAYYFTLTRCTPPDADSDSLAAMRTAGLAHTRFPDTEVFVERVLEQGINYLADKRYRFDNDDEITDTLDLAPAYVAFADSLLAFADSTEARTGFSGLLNRARMGIYLMLDRQESIDSLSQVLLARDTTDIETLDLLTGVAYSQHNDSLLLDLGLMRFNVEPDPNHVQSLYHALKTDADRLRLLNALEATALNSDLDAQMRLNLLSSYAKGYYGSLEEEPDSTPDLDRIDSMATEIIAEDPNDFLAATRSIILVYNQHWMGHYGYSHWLNALDAFPDSIERLQPLSSLLVPGIKNDMRMEQKLTDLVEFSHINRPDRELGAKLTLAQYYLNTEQYAKTLEILRPITIESVRESNKAIEDYRATHASQGDEDEDDDTEDTPIEPVDQWTLIQNIISECQMKLNLVDDALATLNQIIAVSPENAAALNNLAYYMAENGRDLSVAKALVDRALTVEPDNMNALDTRAWILFLMGEPLQAISDMALFFDKVKIDLTNDIISPENPRPLKELLSGKVNTEALKPILGHLARILGEAGETYHPAARRVADFLKETDPENADLLIFLKSPAAVAPEAEQTTQPESNNE